LTGASITEKDKKKSIIRQVFIPDLLWYIARFLGDEDALFRFLYRLFGYYVEYGAGIQRPTWKKARLCKKEGKTVYDVHLYATVGRRNTRHALE
jgi:hypothetical protein